MEISSQKRVLIDHLELTWHLTMKLFPQKILGNIARSMTSERNSALLCVNVDRRPPLQRGLMNFQLYNESLEHQFIGKQLNVSVESQCIFSFPSGNNEILREQN